MRLILDTHVLLSRPELLLRGDDSTRCLLPQAAYQQLRHSRFGRRVSDLVQRALEAGRLKILPPPGPGVVVDPGPHRIDHTDAEILATALEYQKAHHDHAVYLVTDDRALIDAASGLGLKTATTRTVDGVVGLPLPKSVVSKEVVQAVQRLTEANRNYLVRGFLLGVLVAALMFVAWQYRHDVLATLPVWGLVVVVAGSGIALFWFRSRRRLSYGVAEVLFGLIVATHLSSTPEYDSNFFVKIVAAVYIVVRGLDNVEKGISETSLGLLWKEFFSSRKEA